MTTQPFDRGLMTIVFMLLGFGLIMVFSTVSVASGDWTFFLKHLIYIGLGLIIMMILMHFDHRRFESQWVVYPLLGLTVLLLLAAFFSPAINGVNRWIVLGSFRAQPSELAKLAMVLFTSFYLIQRRDKLNNLKEGLIPYLGVLGTVCCLILIEPDLGTAVSIAIVSCLLLFLAGLQYRYFFAMAALAIPAFYVLVLSVPYRRNRILAFLDPEADPLGIGYQIHQSLIAVGSGGISGLGFGQSKQKLDYLPESHTDFIFAIVGEEMGLIGCIALLVLFVLLFRKGVKVALRADTPFGTLLGLGIIGMIVLQALINMSVVVSLLPTKGLPLPFISVGGSSLLVALAGIGILLNISRHSREPSQAPWYKKQVGE